MDGKNLFVILPSLFDKDKPFILIDVPFCEKNEDKSKDSNKNFYQLKSFAFQCITKKVKRLFPLKDKNVYPTCKIYHRLCSCKQNYIGELKRNLATRQGEHNYPTCDSEPP